GPHLRAAALHDVLELPAHDGHRLHRHGGRGLGPVGHPPGPRAHAAVGPADHRAHPDRDRPGPQLRLDLHRDRPPAVGRLRGDGDTHRRLAVGGRGRRVDLDDRLHGALRRPGRRRGQAAARVHPPWRGTLRAAAPRRGRPTAAVHLLTGSTHMDLITVWFVLLAILWTGYLVLEGFDFGVG